MTSVAAVSFFDEFTDSLGHGIVTADINPQANDINAALVFFESFTHTQSFEKSIQASGFDDMRY